MSKENSLYPLKFEPIIKEMLWGGSKLQTLLNKSCISNKCGESWEISDVPGNSSVVANGFLAGNTLGEVLEIYMNDLVGDKVYGKYGDRFPLLIKYIDANDKLSVQVHPDDETAMKEHQGYGKTEMWYVMQAEPDSELIIGFEGQMNKETYLNYLKNNELEKILHYEKVQTGDVFFIPAGRVHAIGAGLLIAEIQQTSDITYRIYDWNRIDTNGKPRQLHTDLALKAVDFSPIENTKTKYIPIKNQTISLVQCQYFNTQLLEFDQVIEKDYGFIDSFVIYMCIEGKFIIEGFNFEPVEVTIGETILIPALLNNLYLNPVTKSAKILEIFVP